MEEKIYLFTEGYNCGLILKKCLESFFKYHPNMVVNVFGTAKDFKEMGRFKNVEHHDLTDDEQLRDCFKQGHLGTAHIWARVIKEFSEGYEYLIHVDSDVIFRKESISLITEAISNGAEQIGPIRCYKNNMNGRKDLANLKDVTQTYFFAFNKNKISDYSFDTLRQMIVGFFNPLNHPILDYFDPVSFDILKNGGNICFLDVNCVGGLTPEGNRKNKYSELNADMDVGDNVIHWAGIGSALKFYRNGADNVPLSYVNWAKKRLSLYLKTYYDKDIEMEYDKEIYEKIKNLL